MVSSVATPKPQVSWGPVMAGVSLGANLSALPDTSPGTAGLPAVTAADMGAATVAFSEYPAPSAGQRLDTSSVENDK